VQLPLEVNVLQFCVTENALVLVPVTVTLVTVRLALPVFVTLMLSGEDATVTAVFGNARAEAESVTVGDGVATALELLPQPTSSPRAAMDTTSPRLRLRKFTPLKLADRLSLR